jgi:hypothetical protein
MCFTSLLVQFLFVGFLSGFWPNTVTRHIFGPKKNTGLYLSVIRKMRIDFSGMYNSENLRVHSFFYRYAHENGCEWDADTCINAAEMGNLGCLKYAHENGCPWDEKVCAKAAEYGHIDCLKYVSFFLSFIFVFYVRNIFL